MIPLLNVLFFIHILVLDNSEFRVKHFVQFVSRTYQLNTLEIHVSSYAIFIINILKIFFS